MTDLYQFGSPTVTQSTVEPYQVTNYNQLGATTTSVTQAYPSTTTYTQLGTTSSVTEAYPATTYQTQVQTYPQVGIQSTGIEGSDFGQLQAIGYGTADFAQEQQIQTQPQITYEAPVETVQYVEQPQQVEYAQPQPVTQTQFQTITRYKPVTKTVMVPKVVTSYVPAPAGTVGAVSVPGGAPLPPAPNNEHFVRNVPIYENDPRWIQMNPSRVSYANPPLVSTGLNPKISTTPLAVNPTLTSTGLNPTIGTSGLNTGLSAFNTADNTRLNLGTGLNQLGTGLSKLGAGLGSDFGNGLNSVGNKLGTVGNTI